MSVVPVNESELHDKLTKCMAGERVLIDHDGNRFSARIQQADTKGVRVIPEALIKSAQGASDEIEGLTLPYQDVWELEVKGVVYSRIDEPVESSA
ncbi:MULTISPECIES: hypothetical protein [unclassified Halomonas]|uniref:hypothetical protein n=1 Tax=unclassified Halomonas TaxID=2609666 RepID=UPI0020766C16|nr:MULTISPECIES: hypothetical protein [unclassified Halomonas]